MVELTLVLGILDKSLALLLVMAQGATAEQKATLVERHFAVTKPLYDLIAKITHSTPEVIVQPGQIPTSIPGLRPVTHP